MDSPPDALIPRGLIPLLNTPASDYLTDDLCLVLLGDSTLTETAQDLQLFLELNHFTNVVQDGSAPTSTSFNFSDWVYKMSNTNARGSKAEVTLSYPRSTITFHTRNRLFFLAANKNNISSSSSSGNRNRNRQSTRNSIPFQLYFRFIGAPSLHRNNVGLRSLNDPKLRKSILYGKSATASFGFHRLMDECVNEWTDGKLVDGWMDWWMRGWMEW